MDGNAIYTIGYGQRSVAEVIGLLQLYGVEYLIDVRSQPYSRFNPEFSKDALETRLKEAGLRYVFMGDTIGGRPTDRDCYVNGKVDYGRLRERDFYKDGIKRLHAALEKQLTVALLCSEAKPQECHRSKLLGETLDQEGVEVRHIDEDGALKTQADAMLEITHGQQTLFDVPYLSKKKYEESA
jgi:uncharacterized protein (DUF488 family)